MTEAAAMVKMGHETRVAEIRADKTLIQDYRPPTGGISVDPSAGRVFLTYAAGKKRSVSWTERGMLECSKLCLNQLWQWHHECTGEEKPVFPFD